MYSYMKKLLFLPSKFITMTMVTVSILCWEGNSAVEKSTSFDLPYCYLDLIFPKACEDWENPVPNNYIEHFYPMNIKFKKAIPLFLANQQLLPLESRKNWNVTVSENCTFMEISQFPKSCIPNKDLTVFSQHSSCSSDDSFEMNRNYNFTTGLLITCLAEYPLDFSYSHDMPYDQLGVTFAKIPMRSNLLYQIQVQLPRYFESGQVHEFSGVYSFYSITNSSLITPINISIQPKKKSKITTQGHDDDSGIPVITKRGEGRIRCESSNRKSSVSLVIVQGSNPTELRLARPCLENDKNCIGKLFGKNCKENSAACKDVFPTLHHGIVRCTCGDNVVEEEFIKGLDLKDYINTISIMEQPEALISLRHSDGTEYEDYELENLPSHLYEGEHSTFLCYFLDYLMVTPIRWAIFFKNGTNSTFSMNAQRHNDYLIKDNTHVEVVNLQRSPNKFTVRASKVNLTVSLDMNSLKCEAYLWNSDKVFESELVLNVTASEKPQSADQNARESVTVVSGNNFELQCHWKHVFPTPVYTWTYLGMKHEKKLLAGADDCLIHNSTETSSHLSVCNTVGRDGIYICSAENVLGMANRSIVVQISKDEPNSTIYIYLAITCSIILLLVLVIVVVFKRYHSQKARLTALEIEAFERGNVKALNENKMTHEIAQYMPYNKSYEIAWNKFETDYEEIGSGAYGVVLKGRIGNVEVAAKTCHPYAEKCEIVALLSELKIMIYLGKHKYLVELIGACTKFLRQGRPYLFVGFCPLGSLESVLKNGRATFKNELHLTSVLQENSDSHLETETTSLYVHCAPMLSTNMHDPQKANSGYVGINETSLMSSPTPNAVTAGSLAAPTTSYVHFDAITDMCTPSSQNRETAYVTLEKHISTSDLIRWSGQIAEAMEYLESKKVIHGDLATRNVLLSSSLDVKVTDFGLSRQLNNYLIYVKTHDTPLPWRWMAIESLRDMVFTSKSDVWSYGITLWEMFSLAELPFGWTNWNDDFVDKLSMGLRPKKPKYCTDEVYKRMQACWKNEPELRPNFTRLKNIFLEIDD